MKNSELLNQILLKLEQEHINLYHDVTKAEIQNYVSSIKNIDNLTNIEFDYEMMKLFTLFKDAHTSYYISFNILSHKIKYLNGKFYVYKDNQWYQVKTFGKLSDNEFYNKLKEIINYETTEWLNYMITFSVNNGYIYKMLNLFDDNFVKLTTISGEEVLLSLCEKKMDNTGVKNTFYEYKILNGNLLYLRYKSCIENKELPFSTFVNQIDNEITQKNINKYILDIRGNTGGNSEILNPFQQLVKNKNMQGCLLIDNGVFSSGIFAVMRFKKYLNACLIGQSTGGRAKHYGYIKRLIIEDKRFCVSTKLFDFSEFFGYSGAIQPDIKVSQTIQDIQEHRDKVLEKAIEVLNCKQLQENN